MATAISDVFFDLDHTLWDFEKNSALAFQTIFPRLLIAVDIDIFLEHYVPVNFEYWEKYRKDQITHEELRYGRFKEAFGRLGIAMSEAAISEISNAYIECLPENNHLFKGANEILDYLKQNYRLHIITNGFDEVQRRKLANSGIAHYFDTVTNSQMAGFKKPHPGIFEYALAKAQTTKEKSIMIGDCIEADVRGALDCGIDAILFSENTALSYAGIKQINHLSDLRKYL
jgi:putative hydrolase of the HAD superfamily